MIKQLEPFIGKKFFYEGTHYKLLRYEDEVGGIRLVTDKVDLVFSKTSINQFLVEMQPDTITADNEKPESSVPAVYKKRGIQKEDLDPITNPVTMLTNVLQETIKSINSDDPNALKKAHAINQLAATNIKLLTFQLQVIKTVRE